MCHGCNVPLSASVETTRWVSHCCHKFRHRIVEYSHPAHQHKADGGQQPLSRRSCCHMQCRGDQERASAINKRLASDEGRFPPSRPSRKYKPGGGQTVTNSSEEVRCCVKVTTRVISFPTLLDMSASSRSSRKWLPQPVGLLLSHLQNLPSAAHLRS